MIKKIKIFDMDGTIIDSSHRYRANEAGTAIDLDFWIKNDVPEMIAKDKFLPLMKWAIDAINDPEVYVIFATARGCVDGDGNYQYLEDNNIIPQKFIHRLGREDKRGGAELKIEGI